MAARSASNKRIMSVVKAAASRGSLRVLATSKRPWAAKSNGLGTSRAEASGSPAKPHSARKKSNCPHDVSVADVRTAARVRGHSCWRNTVPGNVGLACARRCRLSPPLLNVNHLATGASPVSSPLSSNRVVSATASSLGASVPIWAYRLERRRASSGLSLISALSVLAMPARCNNQASAASSAVCSNGASPSGNSPRGRRT